MAAKYTRVALTDAEMRDAKMLAAARGVTLQDFLAACVRPVLAAARKKGELPKE